MNTTGLKPPCGLSEIIRVFGDIAASLTETGEPSRDWCRGHLTRIDLPFAVPLAWDKSLRATRIHCHSKLAPILSQLFNDLVEGELGPLIESYGGCYCFRHKRSGAELSTHAWGIALDLNVATNHLGTKGDMPVDLVSLFEQYGFEWGGRWIGRRRDPMHFQFCRGY
ncbi:MAG TPA: M15 family metallopeptidase [candidate division Zixibacteria bacterium]|nr:M15 family metallopeptidase [candidate division Zixibacteria bacterium]